MVMGPAGVGKSSYCKTMQDHCAASGRNLHVANLDPAAENFEYRAAFDVKELVNLEDVMEEYGLGPNGGLVYCMEFLCQNIDWLKDELESFDDDDYIVLDCPGQVELYSHLPIMHNLAQQLMMWGFRCCSVYLLDALFVLEPAKFISGCLLSLSSMIQLELPHINVITKCDVADKAAVEAVLDSDGAWVVQAMTRQPSSRLKNLTQAISGIVDDFMIVSFVMLDREDEETIEDVLNRTDYCIQYGENLEPKEPKDQLDDGDGEGGDGDGGREWGGGGDGGQGGFD